MKQRINLFKCFLGISFVIGLYGCAKNDSEIIIQHEDFYQYGELATDYSNAVYHIGADVWMTPQPDPYTLDNFQRAYDNISQGITNQNITRVEQNEFDNSHKLAATHYALKIYPKNENEQWKIERLEDVKVAYIPFNYVQLPDDVEIKNMSLTRSTENTFSESNIHTITYEDALTSDGTIVNETYNLPILYAIWPCSKPLPEDIEYVLDYEVFLPRTYMETRCGTFSEDAMYILENEAIALALGRAHESRQITRSNPVITLRGRSVYYDTFVERHIPQKNLKFRFQLGSNIWDTYTQSDGCFSITEAIPTSATVSIMYQHPYWKITRESSTSPHVTSFGTVANWWGNDLSAEKLFYYGSSVPANALHSAVDFYYNGAHSIRTWMYENDGIRVIVMETSDSDGAAGSFVYSKNSRAYIKIYQTNLSESNQLAGTIFHEFGHFTHFGERGGYTGSAYNGFVGVNNGLKESFASYIGNYIAETYYKNLGYTKQSDSESICYQSRQSWYKTSDSMYTPLFVDLQDKYNQGTNSSVKPNDEIKNVPHSVMRRIAQEVTSWTQCRNILEEYIGVYYTAEEFNNFISAYDYWFNNN